MAGAMPPVSLRRMRLRGDAAHKTALLASLDETAWPAAQDRRYLFIRQLRVRAPWWQAAQQVGRQADVLNHAAVSGWRADAGEAPAVYFNDFTELLACLSRDLARGQANRLWFWGDWSELGRQDPGNGLADLWERHVEYLPGMLDLLSRRQLLDEVCPRLSPDQLSRVLLQARVYTGWPLPTFDTPLSRSESDAPNAATRHALHVWRHSLAGLSLAQTGAWLPLIALSLAWPRDAHLLHQPDGPWPHWCALVERLCLSTEPGHMAAPVRHTADHGQASTRVNAPTPLADANPSPPGFGHLPIDASGQALPGSPQLATAAQDQDAPQVPAASAHDSANAARDAAPASSNPDEPAITGAPQPVATQAPETGQHDARANITAPLPASTPGAQTDSGSDAEPGTAQQHFHTGWGGLFYLCNVLNQPRIRALLQGAKESGWHRLYRLGLHLGLVPDPPLARFLARQQDLDDVAMLSTLPPLGDEAALLKLADRLYGHLEAWGPSLLCLPAHVQHDHSHLDVYYDLSDVRLPVRRAGLDIDPGWLPWLGLVVHIHYRDHAEFEEPQP